METKDLIIDKLNSNDKIGYFECISHDLKVQETFMCKYCENINELDFDKLLKYPDLYSIRLKKDNTFIGIILICEYINDHEVEIGYGIGSKYWNKGYMSQVLPVFIDHIFNNTKIDHILASYFIGNQASKKVMIKSNMIYKETRLKELEYHNELKDLDYYEIYKK